MSWTPAKSPGTWCEFVVFATGLAALGALALGLSDGGILFTRPLWSDEIQTVMVSSHPSLVTVFSDLAHGADHGPSLLHSVVWSVRAVTGSVSPTALRAMSLICVWAALVVVYAVLRRRWSRDASVAGALAVGSHPLVALHAFEARYYGPWLLFASLFAWCLSLSDARVPRRRRDVVIGALSILLCTVHWYGVITLALMCGAAIVSYGARWRQGVRLVMPSLAGVFALLVCAPLVIGQRRMLTVNTWVADLTMVQVNQLAATYWLATVPALAGAAILVASLVSARKDGAYAFGAVAGEAAKDPSLLALASMSLLPVSLVVLSLMGQPSAFARYAVPAALAWGPLVGLAMELVGRWPARVFIALLAALWVVNFVRLAQWYQNFAARTERQVAEVQRAQAARIPVVFQSMHTLYAVAAQHWPRPAAGSFLELPDSVLSALYPPHTSRYQAGKGVIVERDVVRVHAIRYGFPRLVPWTALDTTSRFFLLLDQAELPPGYTAEALGRAMFPHHRVARVSENLWLFAAAAGGR